jgi:hypothetical protein
MVLVIIFAMLTCFHLGKWSQRNEIREEILNSKATTIQLPSLGMTINAPKGRIMSVSR